MNNVRFGAFILTHGRPHNVVTYRTLKRAGYTGPVYFIVDNEDTTLDAYVENFGAGAVQVFDKKAVADRFDEGNNFDNRRCIVHARNASFDIAERLGLTHFVQLDDDYYYFGYRFETGARKIRNLDRVFDILIDFFESTPTKAIAFAQGGDHIGGFSGIQLKRKCMNSFLCSTARRFTFLGSINEDVNTYTRLGSTGDLFFTFTGLQLDQKDTQSQSGGMTSTYLDGGTYIKSFSSTLYAPSSVSVSMMQTTNRRLHHSIDWKSAVPKIVPGNSTAYRKRRSDTNNQLGISAYWRYIGIVNTEGTMRRDREDAVQHEADELASEAFDRYEPPIEQWVRDALVGEWGEPAESAAKEVMAAAVDCNNQRREDEKWRAASFRLGRATSALREAYIDHASVHGLYAATAEDNINNAISDEAERQRDMADDRQVDAYQATVRG